ncbi:MAG: M20/M25/M40 family metallo-hydrolase [Planctomycetota bacterium]
MKRALLWILGLALLPLPVLVAADRETTLRRIVEVGRSDNRVMEHLDVLTNRIGARLTGSDALNTACEWTAERFRSFGLSNVRVEKAGEVPVGFLRGPSAGRMIAPEEKTLHFGTNAWSAGTRGVVRGPAMLAPKNKEELEAVRDRLQGAWLLQAGRGGARSRGGEGGRGERARPQARRGGGGDQGAPPRARERRREEMQQRARQRREMRGLLEEAGIAGIITPTSGELIRTGGGFRRLDWDNLPEIPAIRLLGEEWWDIVDRINAYEDVILEFDIRNHFKPGPLPYYNVIADIPGTERPDEYVVVGGHIDSWDGATGTCDNGTGCATSLEAARLLMEADARPLRTIRFMLWSAEEQGLLGSRAYVKAHADEMERISAVLVHDGGTNYLSGIAATAAMLDDFERVFAPISELNPELPFKVRKVNGLRGGGSDHASFLAAGVPGFFWDQQGRADYKRIHHTQFDTFDEAIPEYQEHSAMVVALAALGIADLDPLLSREKMKAPPRRRMGVYLDELSVTALADGGLAGKAGIQAGDVITKVDGVKVSGTRELIQKVQEGKPVKTLTVLRGEEELEFILDWKAKTGKQKGKAREKKPVEIF